MILYTCESGKELQEAGESSFYASPEKNGSHVIPMEVYIGDVMLNRYAEEHGMVLIKKNAQVTWLPQ